MPFSFALDEDLRALAVSIGQPHDEIDAWLRRVQR